MKTSQNGKQLHYTFLFMQLWWMPKCWFLNGLILFGKKDGLIGFWVESNSLQWCVWVVILMVLCMNCNVTNKCD